MIINHRINENKQEARYVHLLKAGTIIPGGSDRFLPALLEPPESRYLTNGDHCSGHCPPLKNLIEGTLELPLGAVFERLMILLKN